MSLFGIVIVFVAGCGASVGDVSGTVTYKGAPLKGGSITLVSNESGPSFSTTLREDGTFSLTQVRGGDYKVCVDTESLKPANVGAGPGSMTGPPGGITSSLGKGKGGPMPGGGGAADLQKKFESGKLKSGPGPSDASGGDGRYRDGFTIAAENAARYIKIPTKYAKPETTDLKFEAKRGSQTLTIELKD